MWLQDVLVPLLDYMMIFVVTLLDPVVTLLDHTVTWLGRVITFLDPVVILLGHNYVDFVIYCGDVARYCEDVAGSCGDVAGSCGGFARSCDNLAGSCGDGPVSHTAYDISISMSLHSGHVFSGATGLVWNFLLTHDVNVLDVCLLDPPFSFLITARSLSLMLTLVLF